MLQPGVPIVVTDAPPRVNVLGVGVSAITMADALATVDRWIATRAPQCVCVTGVHGVMESPVDPSLRDIHNRAGLVTPDIPLVWISWQHPGPWIEQEMASQMNVGHAVNVS